MPTDTKINVAPDDREWADKRFDCSIRYTELPKHLRNMVSLIHETARKKRDRQKAPTKQSVTIRLSPDVLAVLRATGRGWQTLVDDTLRRQFVEPRSQK